MATGEDQQYTGPQQLGGYVVYPDLLEDVIRFVFQPWSTRRYWQAMRGPAIFTEPCQGNGTPQ